MIITLCGSLRFHDWYRQCNFILSMQGHVVLSGPYMPGDPLPFEPRPNDVDVVRAVHKQKIDKSQAIVVINPFGYVGEHTAEDIRHAKAARKLVLVLEMRKKKGKPAHYESDFWATSQAHRFLGIDGFNFDTASSPFHRASDPDRCLGGRCTCPMSYQYGSHGSIDGVSLKNRWVHQMIDNETQARLMPPVLKLEEDV